MAAKADDPDGRAKPNKSSGRRAFLAGAAVGLAAGAAGGAAGSRLMPAAGRPGAPAIVAGGESGTVWRVQTSWPGGVGLDTFRAWCAGIVEKTGGELAFEPYGADELVGEFALVKQKPDVIAIGGIITQYKRVKEIAQLCKQVYPDVPLALGGGIASSLPDFMVARLPIDIVMQGEGEITISELLHRLETGSSLKGLQGVAYKEMIGHGEWQVVNNGWRASAQRLHKGMDYLPWPMRSRWSVDEIYKHNPVGHLNWKTKWLDGRSAEPNQYSVSMIASRGCPYGAKACDYCFADRKSVV